MQAMMQQMPAQVIADFGMGGFDREVLDTLVAKAAAG